MLSCTRSRAKCGNETLRKTGLAFSIRGVRSLALRSLGSQLLRPVAPLRVGSTLPRDCPFCCSFVHLAKWNPAQVESSLLGNLPRRFALISVGNQESGQFSAPQLLQSSLGKLGHILVDIHFSDSYLRQPRTRRGCHNQEKRFVLPEDARKYPRCVLPREGYR